MYRCHSALITCLFGFLFYFFNSPIVISQERLSDIFYIFLVASDINLMLLRLLLTCRFFLLLDLCTRLQLSKRLLVSRLDTSYADAFFALLSHYMINVIIIVVLVMSLQALIQFSDAETASSARNALDGRSIPRYYITIFILFMECIEIWELSDNSCIFYNFLDILCLGISFQSMSVHATCVFHIPLTLI